MNSIHRGAAALLLAIHATAGLAREGDTDPRFSGDGLQTVAYDLTAAKGDFGTRVVVDPRKGRYIAVGYVDGGAVGLAAFRPDGSIGAPEEEAPAAEAVGEAETSETEETPA